jgi:hypothetical protein
MEETRNAYRIFIRKSKEKNSMEDLDIDGRIILQWIIKQKTDGI